MSRFWDVGKHKSVELRSTCAETAEDMEGFRPRGKSLTHFGCARRELIQPSPPGTSVPRFA